MGVGVLAMLTLIAAGCGDSDDGSESTGQEPATTGSAETTADSGTAAPTSAEGSESGSGDPDQAYDPDAVFRYMAGTPANSIYDPHTATSPFVNVFLYPAYDRLVWMNPDGDLEPMLATEWSFSEDFTVLDMKLREGAVFHDGEPFNAEAVKANIERGKNLPTSTVKADLANVESVEVVGEYEVRLNLSAPTGALPIFFSDRAGMMVSPAAFENADLALRPVGAGSFKIVSHEPGSLITFERFEEYWDPERPRVGTLEIHMQLDATTRLNALRSGQVDATVLDPGSDQAKAAEDAGKKLVTEFSTFMWGININKVRNPALGDPDVRRAISQAIDRQGISDALLGGVCVPTYQAFPEAWWPHNPEVGKDYYSYDPEQSEALLSGAGYGPGDVKIEIAVANVPTYVTLLETIQAQLLQVGVELTPVVLEPAQLFVRLGEQSVDGYFGPIGAGIDPAKTVNTFYTPTAVMNPGGYEVPEIMELAAQGQLSDDPEERKAAYQEVAKIVVDETLQIHLCHPPLMLAMDQEIDGLRPNIIPSAEDFRDTAVRSD
jgi:peptide/nickel transport system substrate-binding protein